jgi:hypothetical protein
MKRTQRHISCERPTYINNLEQKFDPVKLEDANSFNRQDAEGREKMSNIFDIPNAERCGCSVVGYMRSHSVLEIEVGYVDVETSAVEKLYAVFETLEYFDGPMHWIGAEFRLGDTTECLELLKKVGRYGGIPDSYLAEHFNLFLVSGVTLAKTDIEVRILAHSGNILKNQYITASIKG